MMLVSLPVVIHNAEDSASDKIGLALAQIYPMWDDEETSDERMAISAAFADPYVAVLRDDSTLLLLQTDSSGDLDEVELKDEINSGKWTSCCLYHDDTGIFNSTAPTSEDKRTQSAVLLILLSSDGKLFVRAMVPFQRESHNSSDTNPQVYRLSDQTLLSVIEGVDCLQPILSDEPPKRSTTREVFTEVVMAKLGDPTNSQPYLIV